MKQTSYGKGTSLARSYIGIVTGALGTLVGLAAIVFMLLNRH
jgi:hypothetical protein